jgi:transposase
MLADLPKGAMLLADKGYDANALRAAVSTQDAWANIPPKTNRKDPICFSPYLYKARNLIERFFEHCRFEIDYAASHRSTDPTGRSHSFLLGNHLI